MAPGLPKLNNNYPLWADLVETAARSFGVWSAIAKAVCTAAVLSNRASEDKLGVNPSATKANYQVMIPNTLYVLGLARTLVSVHQVRQAGYQVVMEASDAALCKVFKDGEVVAAANACQGVYTLVRASTRLSTRRGLAVAP